MVRLLTQIYAASRLRDIRLGDLVDKLREARLYITSLNRVRAAR